MSRYKIEMTSKYLRDLKRARKRRLNEDSLNEVLRMLSEGEPLPYKYRNHKLSGNYEGSWECHIEPDWLLIYQREDVLRIITLQRTGTHSDLLKEPALVYNDVTLKEL